MRTEAARNLKFQPKCFPRTFNKGLLSSRTPFGPARTHSRGRRVDSTPSHRQPHFNRMDFECVHYTSKDKPEMHCAGYATCRSLKYTSQVCRNVVAATERLSYARKLHDRPICCVKKEGPTVLSGREPRVPEAPYSSPRPSVEIKTLAATPPAPTPRTSLKSVSGVAFDDAHSKQASNLAEKKAWSTDTGGFA